MSGGRDTFQFVTQPASSVEQFKVYKVDLPSCFLAFAVIWIICLSSFEVLEKFSLRHDLPLGRYSDDRDGPAGAKWTSQQGVRSV